MKRILHAIEELALGFGELHFEEDHQRLEFKDPCFHDIPMLKYLFPSMFLAPIRVIGDCNSKIVDQPIRKLGGDMLSAAHGEQPM